VRIGKRKKVKKFFNSNRWKVNLSISTERSSIGPDSMLRR